MARGAALCSSAFTEPVAPSLTILTLLEGAQGWRAVAASQKAFPKKGEGRHEGEGGETKRSD